MKKSTILLIMILFMVIGYAAYNTTINIYGLGKLSENISDFKVYLSSLKLNGAEISGINDAKDEFTISDINGDVTVDIVNDSTEYDTEAYLECNIDNTWTFNYTGDVQTFIAPIADTYKLETWGAQGGGVVPGYGGYSTGKISLNSSENLFVVVGGAGIVSTDVSNGGGYNGGGHGTNVVQQGSGGGGATHIAKTNKGLLSSYASSTNELLIVSGGGGGGAPYINENIGTGGSGGGYLGSNGGYWNQLNWSFYGTGGSQTSGGVCYLYDDNLSDSGSFGTFGQGGNHGYESGVNGGGSGGGGGFYGGGGSSRSHGQAGGGSGYIGNSLLSEKSMYCYNCIESTEESIKTVSTTCVNETATSNCAKSGNGYARITLLSSPTSAVTDKVKIIAKESSNQSVKNVVGKSLTCKLKLNKLSRTKKKTYPNLTEWNFDYTGEEQVFTVPLDGTYKLETWGAQGGSSNFKNTDGEFNTKGGYGGYSEGIINLTSTTKLYINVGGQGIGATTVNGGNGGYNGGGTGGAGMGYNSAKTYFYTGGGGGGGATHIATNSGVLSTLKNNIPSILIVSGGGGGATGLNRSEITLGSHGGGFVGSPGYLETIKSFLVSGGTQSDGYSFGQGANGPTTNNAASWSEGGAGGGGSGFYGGKSALSSENYSSRDGAGGSGYIGNSLLTQKSMYCYNCSESTDESTKTVSTTCANATATENCAKSGNGYARITLISAD